ncbi:hypothetical protein [Ferrovibrio sp.]|uniref:hypothetical protein n=1 Tax=Ferrovibrio sp. TaxID=1917215 RepID=UPI00311DAC0F
MAAIHILKNQPATIFDAASTYCGLKGWRDRIGHSEFITEQADRFEVAILGEKATCKRCLKAAAKYTGEG